MKGYKIFNPDFTCHPNGGTKAQYAENQTFEVPLPIEVCKTGIHFCLKASDCFSYYKFDPANIICEVEALGETQNHYDDSKVCTNKLFVGRKLTWAEVLVAANEGIYNTGHSNSGDRNSGDSNSGNRNSGAFCLDANPKLVLFDKLTDINVLDQEISEVVQTMNDLLETTFWVDSENMSDEDKNKYPTHETTGGYLKVKTIHEAWADMWGQLTDSKKRLFTDLENFDADKFKIITGITV